MPPISLLPPFVVCDDGDRRVTLVSLGGYVRFVLWVFRFVGDLFLPPYSHIDGCLIKAPKVGEMENFQEFLGLDESDLAEEKPRMNTRSSCLPSICGKKVGVRALHGPLMKALLQRSGIVI
nr:hypothetical protein [Tanacetum cinerariifolium]